MVESALAGGCKGCFKLLLILIIILIVIAVIGALIVYRVPQKLMPSQIDKHFIMTPDRVIGDDLLAEVEKQGMNTQGVSIFVFPYKESDANLAVVVLDDAEGFSFTRGGGLSAMANIFTQVGGGETAGEANIDRVAVIYRTDEGDDLMNLTAPRQAILDLTQGRVTEEQFMESLDGTLNYPALINEQLKSLDRMMQ